MDYEIASALGEADTPAKFYEQQKKIIAANKQMLPQLDRAGQRAQHPKVHATLDATFKVRRLEGNDAALQVGIFSEPGRSYGAQIRFSNSNKFVDNPKGGDAHGMAIKLLDVEGEKFEPDPDLEASPHYGAGSFDVILLNNETFFDGRLADYTKLNTVAGAALGIRRNGRPVFAGLIALLRALVLTRISDPELGKAINATSDQVPISPFLETFFSTTPYLLGPNHAVKYVVRPVLRDGTNVQKPLVDNDENYLSKRMRRALVERSQAFTFFAQVKEVGDERFSIENPRKPWTGAQEVALADIDIPQLKGLSDAKWQALRFGRELQRYNVWNVTKEHRPLGVLNRLRREVYKELHRTRVDGDGNVYK